MSGTRSKPGASAESEPPHPPRNLVSLYHDFELECAEKHLRPSPAMFTLWLEVAQGLIDQPQAQRES